MNAPLQLRTLGALDLVAPNGQPLNSVLSQPRRTALLVYLVLARPRGLQRREALLSMFSPERGDRAARDLLNTNLSRLRASLGAEAVVTRGNEEVGIDAARIACDAIAFEEALDDGRLEDALALYRGDFLAGFHVTGAQDFEEWVERERSRLRNRAADAALTLAESRAGARDPVGARQFVDRWSDLSSGDEVQLQRAITVLGVIGDHATALDRYATFARHMRDEYGAEPSESTRALVENLQRLEPASPVEPRVAGALPASDEPAGAPAAAYHRWWLARVAAMIVGLVVIGTLVTRFGPGGTPISPPTDTKGVAVLPFTVRGGPAITYLGEGLAEILAARLDGMGDLRAVDSNLLFTHTSGLDQSAPVDLGRSAVSRFGARYFVTGSITGVGDRLELNATLHEPDGEPLARAQAVAAEADVLTAVDELVRQLVSGQVGGANVQMLREAAVTTRSLAALKAYLEGERAFRENRLSDMRAAIERAVAEDSTFALAHYRLAVVYESIGSNDLVLRSIERATRYQDQLSERHRLLVQALHANWRGDYAEADEAYRRAITRYPDNLEAWERLAELQFHRLPQLGHPFTEAREGFERTLSLDPGNVNALYHLTRIAAAEGRTAQLDTLTRAALESAVVDQAIELRAVRAFLDGDSAQQRASILDMRSLVPTTQRVIAVRVASYTGRVGDAATMLADMTPPATPENRVLFQLQSADFAAAAGRFGEARTQLRQVAARAPVLALAMEASHAILPFAPLDTAELLDLRRRVALWDVSPAGVDRVTGVLNVPEASRPGLRRFLIGALSVRLGDAAGATAQADSLAADSEAARVGLPALLDALVHVAAGRGAEALRALDAMPPGEPELGLARQDALARYLRGTLLRDVGRDDEADGWLGSFGDINGWDLAFLAPGALQRAEIAEQRGDTAAAAHHSARALTLWADPDPELRPLLARAAERLRQLSGETPR